MIYFGIFEKGFCLWQVICQVSSCSTYDFCRIRQRQRPTLKRTISRCKLRLKKKIKKN